MDVILRTERLVLRSQTKADIPVIVSGLNDFAVARYLARVPYPYTEADAHEWLATLKPPRPDAAHLAIELEGAGMVGVVGIESELGYWLVPRFHGRGLMTEACLAVLDWHFAAHPGNLVASGAYVGNAPSLNVQRKLGFVEWPGIERRYSRSHGQELDHVKTTLSRLDYEAARARLRSRSWT